MGNGRIQTNEACSLQLRGRRENNLAWPWASAGYSRICSHLAAGCRGDCHCWVLQMGRLQSPDHWPPPRPQHSTLTIALRSLSSAAASAHSPETRDTFLLTWGGRWQVAKGEGGSHNKWWPVTTCSHTPVFVYSSSPPPHCGPVSWVSVMSPSSLVLATALSLPRNWAAAEKAELSLLLCGETHYNLETRGTMKATKSVPNDYRQWLILLKLPGQEV